eukprot:TRINITY_DN72589_c0_g1_i1.p1 TRINITY_DN72589_c0_g1~~TRINITY_DN72589_c0_g1_i1.p1  ORF type:complete len:242 (-),score=29.98 TRINITY_DN72589_c0_g1_i1:179-904(-)
MACRHLVCFCCMLIASYNVLAADTWRVQDILSRLKDDIICLQGTRERDERADGHRWTCKGYEIYSFPAGVNKHTGLCICIKKTVLQGSHVTRVWTPKSGDVELVGRLAGVRIKNPRCDIAVFNAHLPNSSETAVFKKCLGQLDEWIDGLPSRSVPVICCDANAHVGYKTVSGLQHRVTTNAVGHKQPERQDQHGDLFVAFLEGQHLTAANIHFACGGTLYTQSGNVTRIDYICLPYVAFTA